MDMRISGIAVLLTISILACTDEALHPKSKEYLSALQSYKAGEYKEAKEKTNLILSNHTDPFTLAHARYLRGFIFQLQDSLEFAYRDYKKASNYFLNMEDNANISKLYNELGLLFYELDSYGISQHYFELAVSYAKKDGLKKHIANALYGVGRSNKRQGHYEHSLKSFFEARALEQEMQRLRQFIDVQLEIGIVQRLAGNYQLAIEHCWQVMNSASGTQYEDLFKGKAYNNLGYVYFEMGDYKKAEEYLKESLNFKERGESYIAATYNNLGRVYSKLGNHTLASSSFKKSVELNQHKVNMEELMLTFNNITSLPSVQSSNDSLKHYINLFISIAAPIIASKEELERKDLRNRLETLERVENQEASQKFDLNKWIYILTIVVLLAVLAWLIFKYKVILKKGQFGQSQPSYDYTQIRKDIVEEERLNKMWMERIKKEMK